MSHAKPCFQVSLTILVILLASLTMPTSSALAQIDPDPVDHVYAGVLHVQVIGSNPYIQGSTQMDVDIGRDGIAIISAGELTFSGSMDLDEGCVMERSGIWNFDPYGQHQNGPPEHLAVGENAVYQEHIVIECPPPIGIVMDEYPEGNWDGGLVFDWDEALASEAVLTVTNDAGDTITWTLGLIIQLPNEKTTWSALKARYSSR